MSASKGEPYFYNNHSKASVWDQPAELSESDVKQLPGAHYLESGSSGGGHAGQIKASHILVKHAGSRRPSSWKEVCWLVRNYCKPGANER
jgi:peptidyl-prolyl cis-trans isomerase NIMA-interacting 1